MSKKPTPIPAYTRRTPQGPVLSVSVDAAKLQPFTMPSGHDFTTKVVHNTGQWPDKKPFKEKMYTTKQVRKILGLMKTTDEPVKPKPGKVKRSDGAARIAEKEYHDIESPGVYDDCDKRYFRRMRNALATRIRRLVAREVRKEREMCQRLTNALAGEYLEVYKTFPSSMPETLVVAKRLDNLIHQMEKGTP